MTIIHVMIGVGVGLLALFVAMPFFQRKLEAPRAKGHGYANSPGDTCSICRFEMSNDDMRYSACGHAMHEECYERCKNEFKKCPLCRLSL